MPFGVDHPQTNAPATLSTVAKEAPPAVEITSTQL